jgi:uncharacterized membrane protein
MADNRRMRLDQPRFDRRQFLPSIDPEAFGNWTEKLARFLGTGRYLLFQTVFVVCWIIFNIAAVELRFDPYPFILLNLAFSTQAAYAAPLILLAQNRQDDRDRIQVEQDRDEARQSKADLEYLARELASVRMALGEVATRDFIRGELSRVIESETKKEKKAKRKDEASLEPESA